MVFNGGKSQIGLYSLPSFAFPFLNMFLGGGNWANITGNAMANPAYFDRDGYPTSIEPGSGGYYTTFIVPSQAKRPGNYVLGWDNTCTPYFNYSHVAITYAITGAVSAGVNTVLTLPSINPTSPNRSVLIVGQTLSISGCAAPFTSMNGTRDVVAINVGGDPTKVAINFDSSALGAFVATGTPLASNTFTNLGRSVSKGRCVFSTTVTSFSGGIGATGTAPNYAKNMYFCHVDDEEALLAGEMFSPKLKGIFAAAKWGSARDLDIGLTSGRAALWAHRKSSTYLLQSGAELRATLWCGTTTNVGAAFSINGNSDQTFNGLPGDIPTGTGPTDKMVIHCRFSGTGGTLASQTCTVPTNSGASPATINFASPHGFTNGQIIIFPTNNIAQGLFGNIPYYVIFIDANNIQVTRTVGGTGIKTRGGGSASQPINPVVTLSLNGTAPVAVMSGVNFSTQSSIPKAVDSFNNPLTATLIYDAQINAWSLGGGVSGSSGLSNGWSPEIFIRFCAEMGMHPQIVAGQFTCDPMTDYIPSYAAYIRDTYSWMIPRFEGCNELGLNSNLQTGYAYAMSYVDFDGNQFDSDNWYGKTMSTIGQALAAVYGIENKGIRYEVVAAFLGAFNNSLAGTNAHQTKLTSAAYVAQAAPAQSGYTKTPAYNWVTMTCTAQYWNPGDWGENIELTKSWALLLANNAGDTATRDSLAQGYMASGLFGGDATVTIGNPNIGLANHGFVAGQRILWSTTGSLPGWNANSTLFVLETGLTANSFQMSTTINGSPITPTGTISGVHTVGYGAFCLPLEYSFYRNTYALGARQPVPIIKMIGYEGGWSPDGSSTPCTGALTGATVSAPGGKCVLTIATTNITGLGNRPNDVFPGAVVGMPLVLSNGVLGMKQLVNAAITSSVSFAGDLVTWTQTFLAGQGVYFTGTTMPTGITANTTYYVLADSLSGASFKISATPGGSPITFGGTAVSVTGRNTSVATVTFAGQTVTWPNDFVAGQAVFFNGTTLPGGIKQQIPYYVLASGLSTSGFQISATKGGSAITFTGTANSVTGHAGWVVTAIGGALGNNTKTEIDCDSSAFTPYTSGGTVTYADGCAAVIGDLRLAGKGGVYANVPQINSVTRTNYANWEAAGGTFPSHYGFAAANTDWFLFDPDTYAVPSPQYDAIVAYNNSGPRTFILKT